MVIVTWEHFSTRQYKNQDNTVFLQLTWKKTDFLQVAREPFGEDTCAICSLETWSGIGEANCAAKLQLHFFNTFNTFN